MTLGEQIQSLRKAAGLSQEELGDKLGVARQSVSKWESDTTIPELDKLIAMSRLFGVTIGALLGLEESEGADHELTERELQALEAIARKLAPAQEPAEKSKKKRRWVRVLAIVTVWWAVIVLVGRMNNLENQIGSLHYNISNIDNTVSQQIGSLTGQVRDILEEQNSVTAGKNYETVSMDLLQSTVTFALTATPREYKEEMRAVFSATGPDFEAVEMEGTLGTGQTFTTELTCPLTDDITLSVGFVEGDSVVTQQLGQVWNLLTDTQVGVMGNLGWSMTGTGEKVRFTSLTADVWQSTWGLYKTREGGREITVTKGNLRLWVGDTLFWSQECGALDRRSENQGIEIPTEGLTVGAGEKVILSLLYTDSVGREEEVFLDGFVVNEDGRPDMLSPYEDGWENNYPWE